MKPSFRSQPDTAPVQDRHFRAWICLAALLGFAALATPFFLGRVYVADDLGEFHLPVRNFYSDQLARGEPYDWMPGLFGGFDVTAEGQLGAYHPLHQLLYRALPLGAAFDLELLVSYPLMFVGLTLFLRRWLNQSSAACFGALAFTFCGFNLLHFVHPNAVAIVAHIPWLLFAVEVALADPRAGARAAAELAIGLLTASQLLLGYPQYVWFSLLIVTAYALWRLIALRAGWRRTALLSLCVLLGVAAAGIQVLPTFAAVHDSVRHEYDPTFANSGSLHPLNLVQLVAPYLFKTRVVGQNTHELGLYAGAVPFALCVWLLTQRRRWGRLAPLIWAAFIFGGLACMLAMGEFGLLYRWQQYMPLANRFRFPCRALLLVQLCTAVNAAAAITILMQPRDRSSSASSVRWPLVAVVLLSVALAIIAPAAWPGRVADVALVICGPAFMAAAVLLVVSADRGARWSFAALVLATVVDLGCYGMSYSVYGRTADLNDYVAGIALPPSGRDLRVAVNEDGTGLRAGDRMLLAGLKRIDGYAGLEPARQLDYSTLPALELAGVGWILRGPSPRHHGPDWIAVAPTAARVRLVTDVTSLTDSPAAQPTLQRVVISESFNIPAAPAGTAEVLVDRPGRIVVATHAPTRQLLVTTESFHRGWQARTAGGARPVLRVNRDFLGCIVEPSDAQIELIFDSQSLKIGQIVSACGLGLLVCLFGLRCWPTIRGRDVTTRTEPNPD
jgi:hypothetical protein